MRAVVLGMHISLDGYLAGPRGNLSWSGPSTGSEVIESIVDSMAGVDTILLGRVAYQEMSAYWPTATDKLAGPMNSCAKVVFGRTPVDAAAWPDTRVAGCDVAQEVDRLKRQPGQDMIVHGGARFAQSVARLGLVDEYRLMVHPVALGGGVPLFRNLAEPIRLTLVSTRSFRGGALLHVYRPANIDF